MLLLEWTWSVSQVPLRIYERWCLFSLSITRGYECPICRKWFCLPPHSVYSCFVRKCVDIYWGVNDKRVLSTTPLSLTPLFMSFFKVYSQKPGLVVDWPPLVDAAFPVSMTVGVQTFLYFLITVLVVLALSTPHGRIFSQHPEFLSWFA